MLLARRRNSMDHECVGYVADRLETIHFGVVSSS
jgi:hypothetical protein